MAINTDLNVNPYFDDYDEEKNFHRILFKPAVAVQARELTQLQTILQNQIERFGDNIIREGSIVKGGNFREIKKLAYIKIRDNNTSNQPIVISNYQDVILTGNQTGIQARVITTLPGLETQSPDLNTLYIRYITTSQNDLGDDVKQFLPGEILTATVNGVLQTNLTVAIASATIDPEPIGFGYGVTCGDGIIYQKGNFIRFEDQITIVSKYDNKPTGVVVGFQTEEQIINSNNDTSLLDNASGFNNEAAPGADRLKLVPRLVTLPITLGEADETFFAIQEYQDGRLIRRRVETEYNTISKTIEKRTAEESGNYSIGNFDLRIDYKKDSEGNIDPDNLGAYISSGIAYVEGKRVELNDTLRVDVPKADDYDEVTQQDIVANYGNYIRVEDTYGHIPVNGIPKIDLYDAAQTATSIDGFSATGTKIGEAFVRTFTRDGDNFRIYLFDIKMNASQSFSLVRSFVYDTDSAFGNLILEGGVAVLKDSSFRSLIFPIGKSAIRTVETSGTDYVYRTSISRTANTSASFAIPVDTDEVFPYGGSATLNSDQRNEIVVSLSSNGMIVPVISATTSSDASTLTASMNVAYANQNVNVTYNVKKTNVKPIGKVLKTVYMRINPSANTSGPYNLGWPDVYEIVDIWKGSNTTFTEAEAEADLNVISVKNNFTLVKNDTQEKYDISFLKKRGITIQTTDRFLVKAKVFDNETSSEFDQSFFTYNSYPFDDDETVLPEDKIRTESIDPVLRDSIDFRPYVANTAVYATTEGSATIWSNSNNLASTGYENKDYELIAPNESVEASYTYYLARKDRLIINERGDFVNIQGIPSETPTVPNEPKRSMTIATIDVPPFPSLPAGAANRAGAPEHGVTFSIEDNKRYTMRDIGGIEKRIDRLEYYTTLNSLEKSAEDLVILDADGLNRFKNGILVDGFEDLLVADSRNDDFSASVDQSFNELSPKFRAYDIPLKVSGSSSITDHGEVATLPTSEVNMIRQSYATNIRNCVTDFYSYPGVMRLSPEYDGAPDYTRAPDINFNIDLTKPFADFTEALSEFVPLSSVDRRVIRTNTSTNTETAGRTTTTTTTTRTATRITRSELDISSTRKTQKVGDFITDVQFKPFLRGKRVEIFVTGMRPNTRVYVFFDGVNVNQHVRPATPRTQIFNKNNTLRPTGPFGGVLRTDSAGRLRAIFRIPAGTFYVGDRELIIADVNRLEDLTASTTVAKSTYRGYNFSIEKTGLEITTRTPKIEVDTSSRIRTSVDVETETSVTLPPSGGGFSDNRGFNEGGRDSGFDPISQTFTVEPDYTSDNAVLITSVDLFFEKKSTTAGVTVQIRNTSNGYPGGKVMTFGEVFLESSQVNVSNNASLATKFTFPAPITLAADEEYCIVVIPEGNSPDYRIWISRTGNTDVLTGQKVTQDTNAGTLFTSTNNKAWTAYQNENMKFTLRKARFTAKTGNIRFVPDDVEFFEVASFPGEFRPGEQVFVERTTPAGTTISVTEDVNLVTGTGTSFTSYFVVGDTIAYQTGTNSYEVSRVTNIANNTVITIDPPPTTSNTNITTYYKTVAGEIDSVNTRLPYTIHLRNSTAKTGSVFADGDVLRSEQGDVVTITSVRNLPVSYFQPNFYRANFTRTTTDLFANRLFTNGGSNYASTQIPISFNNNNYLTTNDTVIYSKSNEITDSVSNTFELKLDLKNVSASTTDTSPVIDYAISSVTAYEYFINASNTEVIASETFADGLAESKYISKIVELADGFDAEDIKVYLTAYRPSGTNIDVYVKFKSDPDPTPIEEMPWTKLVIKSGSNFSSLANRFDFRELEFDLGTTNPGNGQGAYITSGGDFKYVSADGVEYTNYKFFAVKIVLTGSGQHRIPRVKDMRAIALT